MTKDAKAPPTPTISRVLSDGTMIELLYDADTATTGFAICPPSGTPTLESQIILPTKEYLVPYAPSNNLLTSGCVLLPSAVTDFGDKQILLADIKAFIHRYVDLTPLFEDIAAHYVLLSWVHDAFNELPYLRFQGELGSGKTRALLTVGSISYKPFFASGASTVSPIFHILHEFGGTLVLDEADLRFSDATADLTKILNNGNMKGLPVLRTMTNRYRELNPQAFKVFGPKLIAMRGSFADEALESRFLTEETGGRPLRRDISIHLPDAMKVDAQDLRNKLLAWRFHVRNDVGIDATRLVDGISPRGNQTALALLSLVDDEPLRERIADHLVTAEARAAAKRATLPHVTMVGVLRQKFQVSDAPYIRLSEATEAFNQDALGRGEHPITPKAAGRIVRHELGLQTRKSKGVYVISRSERHAIAKLVKRYGQIEKLSEAR
jgi:hypothetical protein